MTRTPDDFAPPVAAPSANATDANDPVTIDVTARPARLALTGAMTLPLAEELYFAAARIVDENADVEVDVPGVQHLGASAVQILLALGREVGRRGRAVRLVGASDALSRRLHVAGVASDLGIPAPREV